MKKSLIYFASSIVLLMIVISCDVDRVPETSITDGNFWNTPSDLKLAANFFYTTLPGLSESDVSEDNWSSDAYPNTNGNTISDGSRVTPAESADYNYANIFQANKLIEKAKEIVDKGGDEVEVNRFVGEARFFRAWYYFEMLKRFGGVPIITETMGVNNPDIFKPRASRDEVLDLIYADLDYAIAVLKTADELEADKEYGRISRTGALAFKSRVALFEGTRAKFHGYGDYAEHLKFAIASAEEVINSGQHDIYSTPSVGGHGETINEAYFNLFQEAGEGRVNKENVIVRQYGVSFDNNVVSTAVQRYYEGNRIVPTQNFVNYYLMADGLPIDKSPLYTKPNLAMTHAEYFEKKDPRMDFTLFKKGDEFIQGNSYTVPSATFQRSGYGIRKYANSEFHFRQTSFIDKPVLRYAEVLLNYAEALYELNGAISDDQLEMTINKIRSRLPQVNIGTDEAPEFVALPRLTNVFVTANGLDMRNEIRRERKIELAFEGFSYWDLIRWKIAETELPKTLLGSYLFSEFLDADWDPKTQVDENSYIVLQPSMLRRFDSEKDYLWPIPTVEIAKNPKIEQNPGW